MKIEGPAVEDMVALGVLHARSGVGMPKVEIGMNGMTYVERVNLTVQLVDPDAFDGLAPVLAVLPHERGLFQIELASTQKASARMVSLSPPILGREMEVRTGGFRHQYR